MENLEPFDFLGFVDDFKDGPDAEILERGRQLLSPVSAVRPDFLDMRRLLQHPEDHGRSSVPVLHRSRVDGELDREPQNVDDEVSLGASHVSCSGCCGAAIPPIVTTGLKLPKSAEAEFPSQGAANSFRGACPRNESSPKSHPIFCRRRVGSGVEAGEDCHVARTETGRPFDQRHRAADGPGPQDGPQTAGSGPRGSDLFAAGAAAEALGAVRGLSRQKDRELPGSVRTPAVPADPGARLRRRLHGGDGLSPCDPAGRGARVRAPLRDRARRAGPGRLRRIQNRIRRRARRRPESPSVPVRPRMQPMAAGRFCADRKLETVPGCHASAFDACGGATKEAPATG